MRLNLGCGQQPAEGWHNVDWIAGEGVDEVADLSVTWPWPDASVDELLASHLIEHIHDPLHFMQEAWRVAKDGTEFTLACPYGSSDDADEDPTHVRRMFVNSWGYFGQPIYWRGNTDYTGDWRVLVIELRVSQPMWSRVQREAGAERHLQLTHLHSLAQRERNVVQEMVVVLQAHKPARPKDRSLQEDRVLSYHLIGDDHMPSLLGAFTLSSGLS